MSLQLLVNGIPTGRILAAADAVASSETEWAVRFIRELGRSQAKEFIIETLKGTALGIVVGVVVALASFWAFRRMGGYDSSWRYARWFRVGMLAMTVLIAGLLGGAAGFWSGVVRGTERVLVHSQLGTDVLPRLGDLVADGMAWLQLQGSGAATNAAEQVSSQLQRFRAGEVELDAAEFLEELNRFQAEVIRKVVDDLERSALERAPQLKGGVGEKLVHHFLAGFGASLVEKKAQQELKKWGTDRVLRAVREGLLAEAARAGDPRTLTRSELSAFVVREGVVPGILSSVRSAARSQQLVLVALTAVVVVLPPLAIRLGKRQAAAPASPAPPTD